MSRLILFADYLKDQKHIQNSIEYQSNEEKQLNNENEKYSNTHLSSSMSYINKGEKYFNKDGVTTEIDEKKIFKDNNVDTVYRFIYSLKREDADKKGFTSSEGWEYFVREQMVKTARELKIPWKNFKFNFSCHMDREERPHVHIHFWDMKNDKNVYLKKDTLEKIRKEGTKDLFKEEIQENIKNQNEVMKKILNELSNLDIPLEVAYRVNSSSKYGYLKKYEKNKLNLFLDSNLNKHNVEKLIKLRIEYDEFFGNVKSSNFYKEKLLNPKKSDKKLIQNKAINIIEKKRMDYRSSEIFDEKKEINYKSNKKNYESYNYSNKSFTLFLISEITKFDNHEINNENEKYNNIKKKKNQKKKRNINQNIDR